ncbi:MAG: hypothetical protein V4616_13085 [Bacteroidota bacterium]
MKKTLLPLFALALAFTVVSCEKEKAEETPVTPPATAPANPTPATPSDAAGVLVGIKTVTTVATFPGFPASEIELGTAVAVFPNQAASGFLDAGTVTCNEKTLSKQSNNSYVYTPSATDIEGIDFGGASWKVAGNGNVPAIDRTFSPFPSNPEFTAPATISTGSAYTVTLDRTTGADSTIVAFHSGNKSLIKTYRGNITSFQFTAEEMATITKGDGYLQVTPYNFTFQTISGKKIYFFNEAVVTKSVKYN